MLMIFVKISFHVSFISSYLQMTVGAISKIVVKKMIVFKLESARKVIRKANVRHDVKDAFKVGLRVIQ